MVKKHSALLVGLGLYIGITAFYIAQLGSFKHPMFTGGLFLLPPALAVACGLYALRVYGWSSAYGKVVAFLTAGLACWLIGEVLFYLFQFVFHTNPFPSVADVFYLVAYPLLFIGLIKAVAANNIKPSDFDRFFYVMAGIFGAVLAFIVGYFGIFQAYSAGEPLLNNLIAMAYGVGDLILIVPTIFILKAALGFRGGKLFYSWMLIFFSLLAIMAGDILFAIYNQQYKALDPAYSLIDLTWTAGYLLFAYSFFFTARTVKDLQSTIQ